MSFYVNITAKDTLAEVRRHVRKNGDMSQAVPESEVDCESQGLGDRKGDKGEN